MGVLHQHSSQHHSLTTCHTHLLHYIYTCHTCYLYTSHLLFPLSLWLPNLIHTQTLILMGSVKQLDEIKCLKVCFDLFDTKKVEFLSADDLGEIMRAMGFRPTEEELKDLLEEIDEDGSGEIEFGEFCQLCATFLVEDPDMETMKRELKDAFRVYDKEGLGYITTDTLRGLISELLAPLTNEELEGILEELDEDGSGSMDFDEFCEMMMTKPEGDD